MALLNLISLHTLSFNYIGFFKTLESLSFKLFEFMNEKGVEIIGKEVFASQSCDLTEDATESTSI